MTSVALPLTPAVPVSVTLTLTAPSQASAVGAPGSDVAPRSPSRALAGAFVTNAPVMAATAVTPRTSKNSRARCFDIAASPRSSW